MELQTMPLKFRVWDRNKQVFVPWDDNYCFARDEDDNLYFCDIDWNNRDLPEVDNNRFIISQDTGLKDKNGKSIYMGDIVKAFTNINKISDPELAPDIEPTYGNKFVEFVRGAFCLSTKRYPHGGCGVIDHYCGAMSADLEVIGNIWQNPGLLEEK